jgi:1-pyrroline-5-carboxylate dehydrogenase
MYRSYGHRNYVRPLILELGGKNPAIVSRHANLEDAATGIIRSAFGLQGQKCSANSRIYVEAPVYDELTSRLKELAGKIAVGDPTDRNNWMGPVINKSAYEDFQKFSGELAAAGTILAGGRVLTEGELAKGFFCAPTLAIDVSMDHPLWKHEMFLPIAMIAKVNNLDEAMNYANDSDYGLTAGFYGSEDEAQWFFDKIEAGVTYANRPQGVTTGAWPGYQPFGGWKASGATGKNSGGPYYLQLYMHEQIRTLVRPK